MAGTACSLAVEAYLFSKNYDSKGKKVLTVERSLYNRCYKFYSTVSVSDPIEPRENSGSSEQDICGLCSIASSVSFYQTLNKNNLK